VGEHHTAQHPLDGEATAVHCGEILIAGFGLIFRVRVQGVHDGGLGGTRSQQLLVDAGMIVANPRCRTARERGGAAETAARRRSQDSQAASTVGGIGTSSCSSTVTSQPRLASVKAVSIPPMPPPITATLFIVLMQRIPPGCCAADDLLGLRCRFRCTALLPRRPMRRIRLQAAESGATRWAVWAQLMRRQFLPRDLGPFRCRQLSVGEGCPSLTMLAPFAIWG
jgi:hypothetical protein